MTTPNEIKPATPAEALDGGRCAVDAGFGRLDNFERLAVYSAHMKIAHRHREYADEARSKAAERGPLWQRWLKRAMFFDRQARERITRARMFLPNIEVCRGSAAKTNHHE